MRKLFVILAAVAFVVGSTVPALAQTEWSFAGRVGFDTFMVSEDCPGDYGDDDLLWALWGVSGFTARAKTDYGIGARLEVGNKAGNITMRYWYGTWDFGAGTFLIGNDNTPFKYTCAECTQVGDDATSGFYEGRQPQVKLTFGNLQIALIEPKTGVLYDIVADDDYEGDDTDVSLPKIEAAYSLNVGPAQIYAAVAYQTFDVVSQPGYPTPELEYGIDSLGYGLGFTVSFGPGYLKGAATMSENGSYFGITDEEAMNAELVGTQVIDVDRFGWSLTAGYKISDMLALDGWYGQTESEIDVLGVKFEDSLVGYGLNLLITPAKGVTLIPEYSVLDYDEAKLNGVTEEQGDVTYVGLRWKIEF